MSYLGMTKRKAKKRKPEAGFVLPLPGASLAAQPTPLAEQGAKGPRVADLPFPSDTVIAKHPAEPVADHARAPSPGSGNRESQGVVIMTDASATGDFSKSVTFSFGISLRRQSAADIGTKALKTTDHGHEFAALGFSIDSGRPQMSGNSVLEAEAAAIWVGQVAALGRGVKKAVSITDSLNVALSVERLAKSAKPQRLDELPPTPKTPEAAMGALAKIWDETPRGSRMDKMRRLILRESAKFSEHSILWVPRESNKRADRLAFKAAQSALATGAGYSCENTMPLAARISSVCFATSGDGPDKTAVFVCEARVPGKEPSTFKNAMPVPEEFRTNGLRDWLRAGEAANIEKCIRSFMPGELQGEVIISANAPSKLSALLDASMPTTGSGGIVCQDVITNKSLGARRRRLLAIGRELADASAASSSDAVQPQQGKQQAEVRPGQNAFWRVVSFCSRSFGLLFPRQGLADENLIQPATRQALRSTP